MEMLTAVPGPQVNLWVEAHYPGGNGFEPGWYLAKMTGVDRETEQVSLLLFESHEHLLADVGMAASVPFEHASGEEGGVSRLRILPPFAGGEDARAP